MKIAISDFYENFKLSEDVLKYMEVPYIMTNYGAVPDIDVNSLEFKTNSKLIEFIEIFGAESAAGKGSYLKIEEIPKGTLFRIQKYDGLEWIETADDIDWWVAI